MIAAMHKIQRFGNEWHVDVYKTAPTDGLTTQVKIYVLGRNDGAGPRNFKSFRYYEHQGGYAQIPLPKKFADAMLAYVQMRGET